MPPPSTASKLPLLNQMSPLHIINASAWKTIPSALQLNDSAQPWNNASPSLRMQVCTFFLLPNWVERWMSAVHSFFEKSRTHSFLFELAFGCWWWLLASLFEFELCPRWTFRATGDVVLLVVRHLCVDSHLLRLLLSCGCTRGSTDGSA